MKHFVASMLLACGARTELGGQLEVDGSIVDVGTDRTSDVTEETSVVPDAGGCADFTGDPTPTATVDLGTACDEGENTTNPPTTTCGTVGVAWEWVPDHDMAVSRIEIWTLGGSQVAFYDDDNARPSKRLFLASTGGADGDPVTWRGADVSPPISVRACHRYYVHQLLTHGGPCSWTESGALVREFTVNNNGGWDGPFPGMWMARLRGACQ